MGRGFLAMVVAAALWPAAGARAQSGAQSASGGTYVPRQPSQVGQLRGVGRVGQTDVIQRFGRVGGTTTLTTGGVTGSSSSAGFGPDLRTARPASSLPGSSASQFKLPGRQPNSVRPPGGGVPRSSNYQPGDVMNRATGLTGRGTPGMPSLGGSRFGPTGYTGFNPGRPTRWNNLNLPRATLDSRMLVNMRNPLARVAAGPRGFTPLSGEAELEAGALPEPTAVGSEPVTDGAAAAAISTAEQSGRGLTPEEVMRVRIDQRVLFYLERGDELLRERRYAEARGSYELARSVETDSPAPYARMFLATLYLQEYYQAITLLRLAIAKAESIDELAISIDQVAPSVDEFRALARRVAERAAADREDAAEQIMSAYMSWLVGDLLSARRAAEFAAQRSAEIPGVGRFSRLLNGERLPVERQIR